MVGLPSGTTAAMGQAELRQPAQAQKRRVHIKNWGCQMNVYDGGRMADVLAPLGYAATEEAEDADLVILNTCHIRERATDKLFSELGRLYEQKRRYQGQGRDLLIGVAGCVAQAEGEEILKRAPYVTLVFGPQTYHRLPEMIAKVMRAGGQAIDTDFPAESKFDHLPEATAATSPSAFLSVQEGCDKFCTFCVVPYTRGSEYSRPVQAVLDEAKHLVALGAKELTLLGQNVNAYHGVDAVGQTWSLARLLEALAALPGLARLRYTTSHPLEVTDDLIAVHRDVPQLMPFLHLPIQSGADAVLERMNRKHKAADYLRIVEKLRAARPDLALSSDFIVGFPGETEADFKATLALVRAVGYASAYSFKYSARPGTPAAAMPDHIADEVKDARLHELQELLWQQQTAFNKQMVGKTMDVLFDRPGKLAGQLLGKSPYMQSVHITREPLPYGEILPVTITAATMTSLSGTVVA